MWNLVSMAVTLRALVATFAILLSSLFILATIFIAQIRSILPSCRSPPRPRPYPTSDGSTSKNVEPTSIVIVLGSGGHTTEMFFMLEGLVQTESKSHPDRPRLGLARWSHRRYLVGEEDERSKVMVNEFESRMMEIRSCSGHEHGSYDVVMVPRARRIHQSLWTTPFSALKTLMACIRSLRFDLNPPRRTSIVKGRLNGSEEHADMSSSSVVANPSGGDKQHNRPSPDIPFSPFPNLILSNGPGTGATTIFAAVILRAFGGLRAQDPNLLRCIYVESWARVTSLSLTGRLVLPLVDRFLVQWEGLLPQTKGKGEYVGFVAL